MSKVLTFRVSDSLADQLDRFSDISVTEVARAALEEEIALKARAAEFADVPGSLSSLVGRLKVERMAAATKLSEAAVGDALHWASRIASYRDLWFWGPPGEKYREAEEWEQEYADTTRPDDGIRLMIVDLPISARGLRYNREQQADKRREAFEEEVYNRSFTSTVNHLWQRIVDEVTADEILPGVDISRISEFELAIADFDPAIANFDVGSDVKVEASDDEAKEVSE